MTQIQDRAIWTLSEIAEYRQACLFPKPGRKFGVRFLLQNRV